MADKPPVNLRGTAAGGIDLTPTWAGVLPILFAALEEGTPRGKEMARAELRRMAEAADAWNAHALAQGLPTDEEA